MAMKEFTTAVTEAVQEAEGTPVEEQYTEFILDGRVCRAYQPTPGQLTFMMAALGRGQDTQGRFGSIVNIMLGSMRNEDKDYIEQRLLTRNAKDQLPIQQLEKVFEYLIEEWFGHPTQPSSDSAQSPPSDGQN